jgi:hypothetical protein
VGEKMLDLAAGNLKQNCTNGYENSKSEILIREILKNLMQTATKAQIIGDKELAYIISVAIEATREKLLLIAYEAS